MKEMLILGEKRNDWGSNERVSRYSLLIVIGNIYTKTACIIKILYNERERS
jgi:NADH:ubiquinone oxidoreductase subunit B-like Fe-S oxidoreductase